MNYPHSISVRLPDLSRENLSFKYPHKSTHRDLNPGTNVSRTISGVLHYSTFIVGSDGSSYLICCLQSYIGL